MEKACFAETRWLWMPRITEQLLLYASIMPLTSLNMGPFDAELAQAFVSLLRDDQITGDSWISAPVPNGCEPALSLHTNPRLALNGTSRIGLTNKAVLQHTFLIFEKELSLSLVYWTSPKSVHLLA